jgi:hypothetical protein
VHTSLDLWNKPGLTFASLHNTLTRTLERKVPRVPDVCFALAFHQLFSPNFSAHTFLPFGQAQYRQQQVAKGLTVSRR